MVFGTEIFRTKNHDRVPISQPKSMTENLRRNGNTHTELGLETALIRRRLSSAVIRANQTLLISRLGQVGDGAGLASGRRQKMRMEEVRMKAMKEGAWQVEITGK